MNGSPGLGQLVMVGVANRGSIFNVVPLLICRSILLERAIGPLKYVFKLPFVGTTTMPPPAAGAALMGLLIAGAVFETPSHHPPKSRMLNWFVGMTGSGGVLGMTVRTALELVVVPTELLAITAYVPASVRRTLGRLKVGEVAPKIGTLFVIHWKVMGVSPTAAALKLMLSPTRAVSEAGCEMNTGAEGLVLTVRTALELLTEPMGLLTITE